MVATKGLTIERPADLVLSLVLIRTYVKRPIDTSPRGRYTIEGGGCKVLTGKGLGKNNNRIVIVYSVSSKPAGLPKMPIVSQI